MKTIEINDRNFYLVLVDDEIRDGMGVELWEIQGNEKIYLAEVFRNDKRKAVEFTADVKELPFELVTQMIEMFYREVPVDFRG